MLFRMSSYSVVNAEVSIDGETQKPIDFKYNTGHRLNWRHTNKYTVMFPEGVPTLRFQADGDTDIFC